MFDNRLEPIKILFVANTGWYLFNFRLAFAEYLRARGHEVLFVSPRDEYFPKLESAGFRVIDWPLGRKSLNPISEFRALLLLLRIYKEEKPDLCHHFTIKCVLYGSLAAMISHTRRVINSVTGLGHFFLSDRFVIRVLRAPIFFLYRFLANRRGTRYIFQNLEDQNLFEQLGLVPREICRLVRGSGIDLQYFSRTPLPQSRRILFASRMLKEKGIYELIEAVSLAQREEKFAMIFAGSVDEGNPSAISRQELDAWQSDGLIVYLGHLPSIREEIEKADIVVLPSYREGLPRILLEAAAMGRALIASDVPGCREVVQHEQNGLLVPARDAVALKQAILRLLRDETLRNSLSDAAAKTALDFGEENVYSSTLRVYEEL